MKIKFVLAISIFAIFISNLQAQNTDDTINKNREEKDIPQLFITATRSKTLLEDIGRSIDVRTSDDIENKQDKTISETISDISGVRAFDLGGPGAPGLTPIEIRGVRTRGTQVLLDGMRLSDPSSVSGTFENFYGFLTTGDLDRVEVLKGGTGVLYGSDGQGGALNLITKKPSAGRTADFGFSGGSYNTFSESASVNAGNDAQGLLASYSRVDSDGLDANGDYDNNTISLVGSWKSEDKSLTVTPIVRIIEASVDLDSGPTLDQDGKLIPSQDSETNHSEVISYFVGNVVNHKLNDNQNTLAHLYYIFNDRDFLFNFGGFESISEFKSDVFVANIQHSIKIESINSTITGGSEFGHDYFNTDDGDFFSRASRDQFAAFILNRTFLFDDLLQLGQGFRLAHLSDISKAIPTLEASAVLKIPQTNSRIHTSIAEGYRAPTLFESRGSLIDFSTGEVVSVGNSNLDEEQAISYDIGVEQQIIKDKLVIDVTFFQIDSDETIEFDFANFNHVNGGGGKTQGIESSIKYRPCNFWTLLAAYTNLDKATGLDGIRRQRTPRNWFSISSTTELGKLTLSGDVRYRDSQELEFFGFTERAKEDSVTVFDLAASYQFNKNIKLLTKAENIFDNDYTEAGYKMPGASIYGGFKVEL